MSSVDRIPARRVARLPLRNALYNPGQNSVSNLRAQLSATNLIRGVGTFQPPVMVAGEALIFNSHDVWEIRQEQQLPTYGVRVVTNLIPAAGSGSASLAVAANKTMTLAVGDYIFSMGAGTGTATFSGTGGATGTLAANATQRTTVTKTIIAGTLIITASVATLIDLQVEFSTPRADTTTPSEYVSIGVISTPFHGANVDGVQNFLTLNGNSVDGNVVTEAVGAAIDAGDIKGYFAEGAITEESGFSADPGNWAAGTTAQVAQDAVGLQGLPNEAFTLTDSSAVAIQNRRVDTVIADDTKKRYMRIRTPFNAAPTVFPHFLFSLNDGTPLNQAIVFDPSDGTHVVTSSDGSVLTTERVGDWWFITLLLTNNSTGNIQAAMTISPAFNSDATGSGDVTAQGDTVIATCELTEDAWSHSPMFTDSGATATRPASIEATLAGTNFNDPEGSIEFELTPFFQDTALTPDGIITPDVSNLQRLLYFNATANRISFSDGSLNVNINSAWSSAGQTIRIKARWGSATRQFSITAGGVTTLSTENVYDGSFEPNGDLTWFKDLTLGAAAKNVQLYDVDLGKAWLQSSI